MRRRRQMRAYARGEGLEAAASALTARDFHQSAHAAKQKAEHARTHKVKDKEHAGTHTIAQNTHTNTRYHESAHASMLLGAQFEDNTVHP